ncbi:low molecular weight phosphotyrosine protein phosphatase [Vibrio fluvialis]|uniref:arsenate reductase/protein-tyrosine-phosphatase family protein n=1 Tax=Vibrio fluvialis TaxID=676 RepID=UPI00237FF20D|nr:low molecular weight phosphotyrosine protein phosphatase [Vibrio fluvialis]WDY52638.1 low molecular weight phosphotyrosine protein phosphatase [Vibrio fluvialis]
MFNKILVVCVGNICRSPMGERMLQNLMPEKEVASAGIAVAKSNLIGKSADSSAVLTANKYNVDMSGHCSRQLTSQLCSEYDLILVMEKGHIEALTSIAPEARGKTMLFGQWIGKIDIPDPYKQSLEAFEHVYQLLDASAKAWCEKL